jgi:hypothetical protein
MATASRGLSPEQRLLRLVTVDPSTDCWIFGGSLHRSGYGKFWLLPKGHMSAHRAAYTLFKGPIPPGMTVDHLCFQPRCVNPAHLRLLTLSANAGRLRKALSDTCPRGHAFTPENTLTQVNRTGQGRQSAYRLCRTCREASYERKKQRRRAARRVVTSA